MGNLIVHKKPRAAQRIYLRTLNLFGRCSISAPQKSSSSSSSSRGAEDQVRHADFCAALPLELSLQIFSFLNIGEWLAYSSVCRKWRCMLNSNVLWSAAFKRHFPALAHAAQEHLCARVIIPPTSPRSASEAAISAPWKKIFLEDAVTGVSIFNHMCIHKGVDWFVSKLGFLKGAEQICDFLKTTAHLPRARIYQYLCTPSSVNAEVARLYVNSVYNFKNVSLLDAQRQFFDFLHMGNSGHANLLEDMRFLMSLFANKYFYDNYSLTSTLIEKLAQVSHQVEQTLEILIEEQVIRDNPAEKFLMLRIYPHFDTQEVSEYVSQHSVNHLLDTFDFSNMFIGDAIRMLFATVRIQGQTQIVRKMLQSLAHRYNQTNPTLFVHSEAPYVIGYSLLVLNTDTRSPHVKKKMRRDDFRSCLNAMEPCKTLSKGFCDKLYFYVVKGCSLTSM